MPLLLPRMLSVSNCATFAAELSGSGSSTASAAASAPSSPAAAAAAAEAAPAAASAGAAYVSADAWRPVEVLGFGRLAHVFASKQKPKLLTLYGSDFRCVRDARVWP